MDTKQAPTTWLYVCTSCDRERPHYDTDGVLRCRTCHTVLKQ